MYPGAKINDFRQGRPERHWVRAGSSMAWPALLGFDKAGFSFLWVDPSEMILACAALGRLGDFRLPISQLLGGSQWGEKA